MKFTKYEGINIVKVTGDDILISDVNSALDLIASMQYSTGCTSFIIDKSLITEDFFELKTKLAGEILQKYINYGIKCAIVGDFSLYESKSLRDFIYESNHGKDFFFVDDEESAIEMLKRLS